jgi:hypothetical protein
MKNSLIRAVLVSSATGFVTVVATTVLAAPLAPGGMVVLTDESGPTGAQLLAELNSPFAASDIQGTVTSKVYSADADNPLGGLTFTYEIVSGLSQHEISRFSVGDYAGFQTDVSYNLAMLPGVPPSVASRSTGTGNILRFDFVGLPPGQSSTLLVVQTDAQAYFTTTASVIDGGSADFFSIAPTAIPEPATAALVGIGLFTLVVTRRRNPR